MADEQLSERARAILEAAERAATSASASGAVPNGGAPWSAASSATGGPPAEAPRTAEAPDAVSVLVDRAARAAEAARRSLDELAASLVALTRELDAAERAAEPPRAGAQAPAVRRAVSGATPPDVAAELAAGGATRMEADARLRAAFGLRDTRELLDALYGAGSAPDAVAP